MNAKTIRLVAEIARRKKRLAEGRKERWEKIAKAMDKIPTSMSCVTLCKNPPKIGSVATYATKKPKRSVRRQNDRDQRPGPT